MAKFPEMRWEATDVAEEFKLFKQRMELCFLDHGITDTSKQAIKIKIAVGNTGLRTINSSGLTAQDQTDPTKLWNLFESQLKIKVNFRIHRLELMNFRQKQNETLDEFVNRCRHKAKECDFTDDELSERIIELVIASAKCESFQRDLLDKPKGYSLDNVLKEGRKYEAISAGKQCLQSLDTGPSVSVIKSKKPCGHCGLFHPPKQCPAYNDVCKACGNKVTGPKCAVNQNVCSGNKVINTPQKNTKINIWANTQNHNTVTLTETVVENQYSTMRSMKTLNRKHMLIHMTATIKCLKPRLI
ncbi:hypothetical protein HOLleu_11952 [Holothuria leucospilota]|uniref:Uncharacterized protein n=1 Tax=Holothuria leucospilota TaxID=206669 RepID=A0A9Q1HDH8_HOLLE|nr:hypothetical protein HOLleu_11952 [Holothuria leucospilota]